MIGRLRQQDYNTKVVTSKHAIVTLLLRKIPEENTTNVQSAIALHVWTATHKTKLHQLNNTTGTLKII